MSELGGWTATNAFFGGLTYLFILATLLIGVPLFAIVISQAAYKYKRREEMSDMTLVKVAFLALWVLIGVAMGFQYRFFGLFG
jgi:hypothetical protein